MDIEKAVDNSYIDFHVKGLHYLCLERTPQLTRKVYFLPDPSPDSYGIVAPHDHRYSFETQVLAGELANWRYQKGSAGRVYQCFDYSTPLNGGDGFSWSHEDRLVRLEPELYDTGSIHTHLHSELHTIQPLCTGTVIELLQYQSRVPRSTPTQTFLPGDGNIGPSLDGLYSQMTRDKWEELFSVYTRLKRDLPGSP